MEQHPSNYPGVVDQKEIDSLKDVLKELNIEETNSPAAPTKPKRYTSFGGRVRIDILTSDEAEKWIGKTVNVGGWVRALREGGGGGFCFVDLNDGSTIKNLQVIVNKDVPLYSDLIKEGIGSCLQFRGEIVKSPGNKQPTEMKVENKEGNYVKIMGTCKQGEYPLMTGKEAKKMKLETLRDICHLRPRTNIISAVTRIRNNLAYATHIYFQNRGFLYIHTPEITSSDCEGAGSMFQVTTLLPPPKEKCNLKLTKEGLVDYKDDFFAKPTYLTVSGQLEVENFACAMSDVYTFGPTFRAEVSHTSRHLAEFWMIEPEMCFADLFDDIECGENYLKFCLKYVLENNKNDLEFLDKQVEKGLIERLKNVIENDFKRLPYTEAIELLKEAVAKDKKLFVEKKELTKEEKEKNMEIKEAFNVFDKDCDGFITTDELATVMRTLGHNPTKEELDELIKQYDKDESGTIDLNEFMDLMNNKLKEQQEGQELLETFQIFDKDADGTISADDLKYVIKAVGEELEDYLIEELIEQGDRDHDGKINYHEFVRIMTSK
jgi:asparaginyl-tRNA synthetase